MSNFTLVETQTLEVDENEYVSENETYDDIQQGKTQPVVSKLDQKRANKTVECPKCHRVMNKKTYRYSHKCPNQSPQQPTTKVIENTKPSPKHPLNDSDSENEPDMIELMFKQEQMRKHKLLEQKQNRISKLVANAF